jgi:hypothetical protein
VWDSDKSLHEIREFIEITCLILRGILWVIRHGNMPLDWSIAPWCLKVKPHGLEASLLAFRDFWQ